MGAFQSPTAALVSDKCSKCFESFNHVQEQTPSRIEFYRESFKSHLIAQAKIM